MRFAPPPFLIVSMCWRAVFRSILSVVILAGALPAAPVSAMAVSRSASESAVSEPLAEQDVASDDGKYSDYPCDLPSGIYLKYFPRVKGSPYPSMTWGTGDGGIHVKLKPGDHIRNVINGRVKLPGMVQEATGTWDISVSKPRSDGYVTAKIVHTPFTSVRITSPRAYEYAARYEPDYYPAAVVDIPFVDFAFRTQVPREHEVRIRSSRPLYERDDPETVWWYHMTDNLTQGGNHFWANHLLSVNGKTEVAFPVSASSDSIFGVNDLLDFHFVLPGATSRGVVIATGGGLSTEILSSYVEHWNGPGYSRAKPVTIEIDFVPCLVTAPELIDPYPNFIADGKVVDDTKKLARADAQVRKIAADGVTQVVVRSTTPSAGEVEFCLKASGTPAHTLGGLGHLGVPGDKLCLRAPTEKIDNRHYAFVQYSAPEGLPSEYDESPSRQISIVANFIPNSGGPQAGEMRTDFDLVRPPLVLIHGLWSSSDTWALPLMTDPRFDVTLADYRHNAAASFWTNSLIPRVYITQALQDARNAGVAVTQADVIAHSMGGLLARIYANSGNNYKRSLNFNEGDIHKLITLNTPHAGSQWANILDNAARGTTGAFLSDFFTILLGRPLTEGAVTDLAIGSEALGEIGETEVPSHAFVGIGGGDASLDIEEVLLANSPEQVVWPVLGYLLAESLDVAFVNQVLNTSQHDMAVPYASMRGGMTSEQTFTVNNELQSIHTYVTEDGSPYTQQLVKLLNTPNDDARFGVFPASSSIAISPPPLASTATLDTVQIAEGLRLELLPPTDGGFDVGETACMKVWAPADFAPDSYAIAVPGELIVKKAEVPEDEFFTRSCEWEENENQCYNAVGWVVGCPDPCYDDDGFTINCPTGCYDDEGTPIQCPELCEDGNGGEIACPQTTTHGGAAEEYCAFGPSLDCRYGTLEFELPFQASGKVAVMAMAGGTSEALVGDAEIVLASIPEMAELVVSPTSIALEPADTFQVGVTALYSPTGIAVLTGKSGVVTFTSSDTAVAAVDATGMITAKEAGTTRIAIVAGTFRQEIDVMVIGTTAVVTPPVSADRRIFLPAVNN